MNSSARHRAVQVLVLLVAGAALVTGCNWGLPSRAVDSYLFGQRQPWSGAQINALAPSDAGTAGGVGADVDANPIADRSRVVVLNETDSQRAEIIRRYRLFSYQPDEMITFKSLSRIRQYHGDPRLYQYGGLWMYPVGALIKLTLNPVSDSAYYLDHPEEFGRFYIVARLYSAMWGLIAVWAVMQIIRRMTTNTLLAAAGAVCFAFTPVVITGAHEAKPHLPGAALALLAILSAANYVESGRMRWALIAGVLCGASFGMVLSGLTAFAVLPVMVLLRRERAIIVLAQAIALGVLTYAILNPFVIFHLLGDRTILRSNMGNSTAMYATSLGGIRNAARLIVEASSPVGVIAGVIGLAILARRPRENSIGWLLAGPAVALLVQFVLLATNKPPEYARFAILITAGLIVAAFAAIGRIRSARPRATLCVAVAVVTIAFGLVYLAAFIRDSGPITSRRATATQLVKMWDQPIGATIAVPAEPAPYCMPPVDLFRNRLILVPADQPAPADIIVNLPEYHSAAPISWANVRFFITRRPAPPWVSSGAP